MMRKIYLIILVLAFSSCLTEKKCTERYPCNSDIIHNNVIKEVLKDSIVYIDADKANISVEIECDSIMNAYIKSVQNINNGKKSKISVKMKDNVLTAVCEVDSHSVYLNWKERYEERLEVKTKVVYKVKALTQWQIFQIWLGRIFLLLILLILVIKIIKLGL